MREEESLGRGQVDIYLCKRLNRLPLGMNCVTIDRFGRSTHAPKNWCTSSGSKLGENDGGYGGSIEAHFLVCAKKKEDTMWVRMVIRK